MSFTCIKTLVGPHIESKLLPDTKSTLDSAPDLLDLSCNKKGAGLMAMMLLVRHKAFESVHGTTL